MSTSSSSSNPCVVTDDLSYPHIYLSHAGLRLLLYLPDSQRGYYRSSRFDWAGLIAKAEFQGHVYYSPWRVPHDPANPEHGIGPCEEFGLEDIPPLFVTSTSSSTATTSKSNNTYVKVGVGICSQNTETQLAYDFRTAYPVVQPGLWNLSVHQGDQGDNSKEAWIEFDQTISHRGVGYHYTKRIVISGSSAPGEFRIEHRLENTGTTSISTTHYNHNFVSIDGRPIGTDYEVQFPVSEEKSFEIHIEAPGYADVEYRSQGHSTVKLKKPVNPTVPLWTPLKVSCMSSSSAATTPTEFAFAVVNHEANAGIRISLDKLPKMFNFYAADRAICPEAFIPITLQPKEHLTWAYKMKCGGVKEVSLS